MCFSSTKSNFKFDKLYIMLLKKWRKIKNIFKIIILM